MARRVSALVALALVVAASAACRSGDSLEDVEDRHGWAKTIDTILQQAQAAGASDEQMAILEEAQATGEISFEVYSEAVDQALRCIREAGGRAEDRGTTEHEGVLQRGYSVGVETEAADPVEFLPGATVHRCIAEHSIWVEAAYTNQPSSVEAKEAFWEGHRDAIVACLRAEASQTRGGHPHYETYPQQVRARTPDRSGSRVRGRRRDGRARSQPGPCRGSELQSQPWARPPTAPTHGG